MGEFRMRWRISVCWDFNTQGPVIDMVWLSHGEEIPWIKTQDKRTISFLNWKIYSDRPVFTLEKQIRSILSSNEGDWSKRTASHLSTISRLFETEYVFRQFRQSYLKYDKSINLTESTVKFTFKPVVFCRVDSQEHAKNFWERLQLTWSFADLVYDGTSFALTQNLEQEFLRYEITDFLFLSSRVFLRSCSFDLQDWKPVFSRQEPQIATHERHGSHFE